MGPATATQLITVGGTLGGVILTLAANGYLERRRARDTRELETLRAAAEQVKWLRDERLNAYAALSTTGEHALHFIRNELPPLMAASDPTHVNETEARWRDLRTELRKAYNRVSLVGAPETISAGREIWRTARNGANDFFRAIRATPVEATEQSDLYGQVLGVVSQLGNNGDRFMEACRRDLQS